MSQALVLFYQHITLLYCRCKVRILCNVHLTYIYYKQYTVIYISDKLLPGTVHLKPWMQQFILPKNKFLNSLFRGKQGQVLLILLYKEVLVGVQYRNLDIKILKSIPHLNLFIVVEASCCSWMGGWGPLCEDGWSCCSCPGPGPDPAPTSSAGWWRLLRCYRVQPWLQWAAHRETGEVRNVHYFRNLPCALAQTQS